MDNNSIKKTVSLSCIDISFVGIAIWLAHELYPILRHGMCILAILGMSYPPQPKCHQMSDTLSLMAYQKMFRSLTDYILFPFHSVRHVPTVLREDVLWNVI